MKDFEKFDLNKKEETTADANVQAVVQEPKVEEQAEEHKIKTDCRCGKYVGCTYPKCKEGAEEQLKEKQEYQPDIHQIVIASNVIRFLNQYIHGIAAGRTEEKNKLNLIDAADHFKNLKF